MTKTLGGSPHGVGATYAWGGDENVGEGRMTITESRPNETVGIRLEFIKPLQATNAATFTFAPNGQGTTVTWAMEGTNSFAGKMIGMFIDVDAMVGEQFEKGLGEMKAIAESGRQRRAAAPTAARTSPAGTGVDIRESRSS